MGNVAEETIKESKAFTRGDRNIAWIEKYCRIPEGKFVGQKVKLRQWQRNIIKGIYDTPTRTAIISFGRKNAKTALSAFLLLLNLCGPEAKPNSQLYSSAQARDQAAVLFKLASQCVKFSPDLSAYVKITPSKKTLTCQELGTEYVALSSEAKTKFGASPVFLVHDELGQVRGPTSDLFDALETACGAHDEPLSIIISTQAATDNDLLSILIDDALEGNDPTIKVFLYTTPEIEGLDLYTEDALRYANPALGDFLNVSEILKTAEKARRMPSMMPAYRNLHLNQRVERNTPFVSRDVWDSCKAAINELLFSTYEVVLAIDLSSRQDLTAIAIVCRDITNGHVHVKVQFYAPSEGLAERSKRDKVPYDVWVDKGFLKLCPGVSIDYDFIAEEIENLMNNYNVIKINFDRWRIDVLKSAMSRRGLSEAPLHPFGQGFKDMSPAIDELESLLVDGKIHHGGNPILKWNAANAVVVEDTAQNRKLDKRAKTRRIDGIVATVMAIGGLITPDDDKVLVYNYTGLLTV